MDTETSDPNESTGKLPGWKRWLGAMAGLIPGLAIGTLLDRLVSVWLARILDVGLSGAGTLLWLSAVVAGAIWGYRSFPFQWPSLRDILGVPLLILGYGGMLVYTVGAFLYYFTTFGIAWGVVTVLLFPMAWIAASAVSLFHGDGGGLLFLQIMGIVALQLGWKLKGES